MNPRLEALALRAAIPPLLVLLVSAPTNTSVASPGRTADRVSLRELAERLTTELEAGRTTLYRDLLSSDGPGGRALTENPDVQLMYVDTRGRPVYYGIDNLNAARTISTDDVWPGGSAGLSLTGSATQSGELAVWDAGAARVTHVELTPRAQWADAGTYATHWHATHVAGTMAGAGVASTARGMSYQAPIDSYDWTNDASEMATAAASGLRVSNHSYGLISGWWWDVNQSLWYWFGDLTLSTSEDFKFGFYNNECAAWDQIVVNAPTYTIVKSAGNDHQEGPAPGTYHSHWDATLQQWVYATDTHALDGANGFDCIPAKGNAKNVITVGAVFDIPGGDPAPNNVIIAGFSGRGPTDDGRIKPDIVANGTGVYSAHDQSNSSYAAASGTSMATPNASGSINLLVDYFESLNGGRSPLASTVKALVINTADEAGTAAGPDYTHGWGLMNTREAVELVQADSAYAASLDGLIVESTLAGGAVDTFYVWKTQWEEVRMTLAWTDPAATPPTTAVDPTAGMLVNDLDLRCERVGDGWSVDPWFLDPTNPGAAAQHGDNARDNVERLELANGSLEAYYRVTVSHKGSLAGGSQDYSLVADRPLSRCIRWSEVAIGTVPDNGYPSLNAAWGDYDADGDQDLFLGRADRGNLLYRNEGDGTFVDVATGALADSVSANGTAWADHDNDGDLDLFVVGDPNRLFRNDGSDRFVDVGTSTMASSHAKSVTWGDYDADGYLDLYLGAIGSPSRLLHNETDGSFADSTAYPFTQGFVYGSGWVDYDDDGDLDLYLSRVTWGNVLLRNDEAAGFVEVSPGNPINHMGDVRNSVWGDYDNDEDLDVYVVNVNEPNVLFRNDGGLSFVDVTTPVLADSSYSVAASWGDMDNDGDLDIVLGTPEGNQIIRNDGPLGFVRTIEGALIGSNIGPHAALADCDGDGDLDIYRGVIWGTSEVRLVVNGLCNGYDYLDVTLSGTGSNYGGVGSRVRIVSGGQAQIREISSGAGYLSQSALVAHFGLGPSSGGSARQPGVIDTLQVFWPHGAVSETTMVAANQTIDIADPAPPIVHARTHDVGNLHVTMTDQGGIGFTDDTQSIGAGLVYPAGGANELYIGSLWVSDGSGYVAAHGYGLDPVLEWAPELPGGQATVVADSSADQAFRSTYTDAAGAGAFRVEQTSRAWSDAEDDDYVIVRYVLHNTSGEPLDDVRAGLFLDLDMEGTYGDDVIGTDVPRNLAYMSEASGPYVGAALLEGGGSPYFAANVTAIYNPTYVHPTGYISDSDKNAFLEGRDSTFVVTESEEAADWSVLVSAGPFSIAAGDSATAVFALVGGSSVSELVAAVDRAQAKHAPQPVAVLDPADLPTLRLLPMAPNPFASHTAIRYVLPDDANVRMNVYDVRGRRVSELVHARQSAGTHAVEWAGRDGEGRRLASGIYFVRLDTSLGSENRRVTLLR